MLSGTPDTNQPKKYRRPRKLKYLAINAFLLFHILAISCWALPLNNPLISSFRQLVRPYFIWSGLFQSWDMFSPDPKRVSISGIVTDPSGGVGVGAMVTAR